MRYLDRVFNKDISEYPSPLDPEFVEKFKRYVRDWKEGKV